MFVVVGLGLTGILWNTSYSIYIFKIWMGLFLVTLILGAVIRCRSCSGSQMSHFEALARMVGIILAVFFLLNGAGVSSASIVSNANAEFMSLSVANNVGDVFATILYDTKMLVVVGFVLFGLVLVNLGDAQDSPDIYTIGALAITVVPSIMIIFTLIGWIAPNTLFLEFGAMAPLAQSIGVMVITMFLAAVGFMFDDVIKSAKE
jgi:hypothetical protein